MPRTSTPPLTVATLDRMGVDPGRAEVPDGKLPGLYVRGDATGFPVFFVRKRIASGARPRVTLGHYPSLGLADARRLAAKALLELHEGRDPNAERRQARAEAEQAAEAAALPTVRQCLRDWQAARDRAWSVRHARDVARTCRREIEPKLGARALKGTTRLDWTALVAAKQLTAPAMAAAMYRTVSSFLNHAEASGWIDTPLLPRRGGITLAPSPKARQRVLTDPELVQVWHGTEALSPRGRALVRLLILTGARLSEVAGLIPAELDREAGIWRLPPARAKNRRGHAMPLCPEALAELDGCGCRPITGAFSKLKRELDAASGVRGWRLHDLRRTARTGMSRLGVTREVAERALNHALPGLVRVYDLHAYELEVLEAIRRWQAHVLALVALRPSALEAAE